VVLYFFCWIEIGLLVCIYLRIRFFLYL